MRTDLPGRLPEDLMPQAGERVLCAVSGGLDSMCLLRLLEERCRETGAELFAAHLNHLLRGGESDRDEAFVRAACDARGIPLTVERADVSSHAREAGQSVEEAGRALRYDFLNRTARALGCAGIYTAHHADDNAETVLWNLIRGTGLKGLTGIPRRRDLLRRPLLEVTRAELEEYAAVHGIAHVHDRTNDDPAAASRNLLRLRVMPLLKDLNPKAAEHIAQTAAILAREDEALEFLAKLEGSNAMLLPNGVYAVFTDTLRDWPRASSERMLLRLMGKIAGCRRDFTARHVQAVLALKTDGSLSLPHGLLARREGDCLYFEKTAPFSPDLPLKTGETVSFETWTVTLASEAGKGISYGLSLPEGAPLAVTHWRGGDRLRLPGQRGARTLKRLCAERGIFPRERGELPVLRVGEDPAAVPGVGIDEAFAPRPDRPAVYISFIRQKEEDEPHEERDGAGYSQDPGDGGGTAGAGGAAGGGPV